MRRDQSKKLDDVKEFMQSLSNLDVVVVSYMYNRGKSVVRIGWGYQWWSVVFFDLLMVRFTEQFDTLSS